MSGKRKFKQKSVKTAESVIYIYLCIYLCIFGSKEWSNGLVNAKDISYLQPNILSIFLPLLPSLLNSYPRNCCARLWWCMLIISALLRQRILNSRPACATMPKQWRIGSRVENYLLLQRIPVPVPSGAPTSTWCTHIHSGTQIYFKNIF